MNPNDAAIGRMLIPAAEIHTRISGLARRISDDYAGVGLLALTVLRGGFVFGADLIRRMDPAIAVQVDFLRAGSYGDGTTSSGRVDVEHPPPVDGRDVLIVEDIVDTGRTLTSLQERIRDRGARSLRTVTLLDKEGRPDRRCTLDYVGFRIPDLFVVGYGLDYAQMYRHLPDIHVLNHEPRPEESP